ncbi:hypothetical protein LVJ94_06465 [Pendulispora rubella]|uniref:PIN domain-containing protein n=1 Tax=Pendulispora rubella TaxID=2741070 RepID=A0ABZ2L7H2_9BACT
MIWQDGWAHGWAEARVHDVFLLLELRGIAIPDTIRRRIRACTSASQLDAWFIRAATATKASEVVDGDDGLRSVGHLLPRPVLKGVRAAPGDE